VTDRLQANERRHRCAVLGSPIEHSLSPALHRCAYAELGLDDWTYGLFDVAEHELAAFVAGCDQTWRGLSLTMPLKLAALELGRPDKLVTLVGAANTLIFEPDGRRLYNTDVAGLVASVRSAGIDRVERVTILGAGGTARSALVSASLLGTSQVSVVVRTPAKADVLRPVAEELGIELSVSAWDALLPAADLVVSTVSAGAADARAEAIAASSPVVFDALYEPWPTPLAVAAERTGCIVLNGLDLLVHQAVEQIALMTGRRVDAAVLMSAGRKALSAHGTA
jgi:shikimate dehydrogenase